MGWILNFHPCINSRKADFHRQERGIKGMRTAFSEGFRL
jgi:hypothetical protein